MEVGRCSQCAEIIRMLFGLGMASDQALSSRIHASSSSRIGAPCAANTTGMRDVAAPEGAGVFIVAFPSIPLEHPHAMPKCTPGDVHHRDLASAREVLSRHHLVHKEYLMNESRATERSTAAGSAMAKTYEAKAFSAASPTAALAPAMVRRRGPTPRDVQIEVL